MDLKIEHIKQWSTTGDSGSPEDWKVWMNQRLFSPEFVMQTVEKLSDLNADDLEVWRKKIGLTK